MDLLAELVLTAYFHNFKEEAPGGKFKYLKEVYLKEGERQHSPEEFRTQH